MRYAFAVDNHTVQRMGRVVIDRLKKCLGNNDVFQCRRFVLQKDHAIL